MSNHSKLDERALLELVVRHADDDFVREFLSWP